MRTLDAIYREFEAAGFVLIRQRKHRIYRCPCGHATVPCHSSPCGGRGDQNERALMRRILRQCQPAGSKAA